MADGGEGTVEAVIAGAGGAFVSVLVTPPLPGAGKVEARYGLLDGGRTAVIEMAQASGLPLVPHEHRDPRYTSTYGTGELLADALDRGVSRILLGIGGSATNDGGAGMAQALGVRLLDAQGEQLPPGGAALARLDRIDLSGRHPRLDACAFQVACDVTNPLCGPNGASAVFGPQKGATPEMVEALDTALCHYARVLEDTIGRSVAETPGSGAAGGLGAGLLAFTRATLRPGVEIVGELVGLREKLAGASLVITGEGRVDGQTVQGKVPAGVARCAGEAGVPVVVVAGSLGEGYERLYEDGVTAILPICAGPMSLEEALQRTRERLEATGMALARLWRGA
jgi:glycerate kinase